MRIGVFYRGSQADLGLKRYVGLRLMSFLDRHERRVDSVTVLLDEAHVAPDDVGSEHRCRVVARLVSGAQVAVEHTSADMYAGIDAAAERLSELVRGFGAASGPRVAIEARSASREAGVRPLPRRPVPTAG